jgi:phosphorylated adapter RNA export protein
MDALTPARLAQILQEPRRDVLTKVLRVLGPARTTALLVETLHTEAAGGLRTVDGTRRRTPGGVFFHLVRQQVSQAERWELFRR